MACSRDTGKENRNPRLFLEGRRVAGNTETFTVQYDSAFVPRLDGLRDHCLITHLNSVVKERYYRLTVPRS